MGNGQSIEQATRRNSLAASQSKHDITRLVVPLPDGGYSTSPEVRAQLRSQIFGDASDETVRDDARKMTSYHPRRISEGRVDVAQWAKILHIEEGQQVDVAGLAAMLQELKKSATSEEMTLLHKALLPSATLNNTPTPLNPATPAREETFEYRGDVIRRRSLFAPTPGTATRTSTQKLKKQPTKKISPSQTKKKGETWREEDFVSSPLSRLAGLNASKNQPPTPLPRPDTPLDLECTNLGTHQLGSLRITNASPAPSMRSQPSPQRSKVSLRPQEDYFNCVDGTGGISPGNMTTDDSKSTLSSVDMPPTPSSNARVLGSRDANNSKVHVDIWDSEPRPNITRQFSFAQDAASGPFSLYLTEASSNPYLSMTGEDSYDASPDYHADGQMPSSGSTPKMLPLTPTDTESIYSSRSRPASPRSLVERSRNEAFSRLNGGNGVARPAPRLSPMPSDFNTSGGEERSRSEHVLRPYSFMTIYNGPAPRNEDPPPVPPTARGESKRDSSLPTKPTLRDFQERKAVVPGFTYDAEKTKDCSAPSASSRPEPKRYMTSDAPLTTTNVKAKPNKLQRKRAKSQRDLKEAIIVQSPNTVDSVPSVPTQVASGYARRMSSNPQMEHLEHTYDSVSASEKRSPELQPLSSTPIRFPSPSRDATPETGRGRKSARPISGIESRPRSLFRSLSRKSLQRLKEKEDRIDIADEIISIADFGTVTESLGRSPYDAASSKPRQRKSSRDTGYPHQMASRRVQPIKSTHCMDEQAASQYALSRSRDRLANLADANAVVAPRHQALDKERPWSREIRLEEDVPPMPAIPRCRPKSRPRTLNSPVNTGLVKSPATSAGSTPNRLSWPLPDHEPEKAVIEDEDDVIDAVTASNTTANAQSSPSQHNQVDVNKGWEAQAQLWRQRRKSIGEGLGCRSEPDVVSDLMAEPEKKCPSTAEPEKKSSPTPASVSAPVSTPKPVELPTVSGAEVLVTTPARTSSGRIIPGPFTGLPPKATKQPMTFRPLTRSPERPFTPPSNRVSTTTDYSPTKSSPTTPLSRLQTPILPKPSPASSVTAGSRSPSPTVKQRAAMFERVDGSASVELARAEAARGANMGMETKAGMLSQYCVNGR